MPIYNKTHEKLSGNFYYLDFKIENSSKFSELHIQLQFFDNRLFNFEYNLQLLTNLSKSTPAIQKKIKDFIATRNSTHMVSLLHDSRICASFYDHIRALNFISALRGIDDIDNETFCFLLSLTNVTNIAELQKRIQTSQPIKKQMPGNEKDIPEQKPLATNSLLFFKTEATAIAYTSPKNTSAIPEITPAVKEFIAARARATEKNSLLTDKYNLDTESEELEDLVCPFTLGFPEIPVTFNGRLYEYNELIKRAVDGYISDIETRERLPINTIQPAYLVQKRLDRLLKAAKEKEQTPSSDEEVVRLASLRLK